ncbi:MAG: carboxypeptidase regulatory-like domain-containing protein [Aeromicrobium sp.]
MNITRTIRTPALLLAVVGMLLAGLTLPAQAAAKTGAVKGVVTLDGKPVKGLKVELYWIGADSFSGPRLGVDTTNSKGAYSFSKLPTKDKDSDLQIKAVVITDPSGRIVATSRKFRDRAGKTVTRNVSVKKAASITGAVTRGDGRATAKLRTLVFGPDVEIDPDYDSEMVYDTTVPVAKNGSFKLRGLPAGDYYLQFLDEGKTYFSQCYDNLPAATNECDGTFNTEGKPSGTKITVRAGQNIALNSQSLSTKGRRISGTVTDTSGRPIRDASVSTVSDDPQKRLATESSKSGAFTVGPATNGSYRLEVRPGNLWAPQSPRTVFNANGQDVTGVQIKLKSRAHIEAKVTPGKGTAKFSIDITRTATGSKPSGKVTVRWGQITKNVNLVKGKATAKLSGLPRGTRTITVSYAGTSSTAATPKKFRTAVK